MMKKIVLFIVIIICSLIMISCENVQKEGNKSDPVEGTTVIAYSGMNIVEELGMKNVFAASSIDMHEYKYMLFRTTGIPSLFDRFFVMDGRIYIAAIRPIDKNAPSDSNVILHSYDFNGENVETLEIPRITDNAVIRFMWYDSEYNQIIVDELDYKYTLHKIGGDSFSATLDINKEIVSMVVGEDDNIYIGTAETVIVYSKSGEKLCQVQCESELYQISSAHHKKPIFKFQREGIKYSYLNLDTLKFEPIEMAVQPNLNFYTSYIMYGEGYDYYHMTDSGIFGYDIATNTLTKVLDWINSDITFDTLTEIQTVAVISSDKIAMITYDPISYRPQFNILRRLSDDEIPDKIYLSIGYINPYDDTYLTTAVTTFNKYSDKYRITLKNYYSPFDEFDASLRFNNDIAAGNTPDIMFVNSYAPVLSYTKQNMFVDLNEYLANDQVLSDNLLPFVKNANINGKLPQMITVFKFETLLGKVKNIGDKNSWSYADMLEMYKSLPADTGLTGYFEKGFLRRNLIKNLLPDCIDYDNGTCNFDIQGFKDFLEFYKAAPDTFDTTISYEERTLMCRTDEYLLYNNYVNSITGYYDNMIGAFRDEEVNIIGYPTSDGLKHSDNLDTSGFAIFNSSPNKDAAWEFIKYCLSDKFTDYQSTFYSIIPTASAIDIITRTHRNSYSYIMDTFGTIGIYDDEHTFEEIEEEMQEKYGSGVLIQFNDDRIDKFRSYLTAIDSYIYTDTNILNIIYDEMSAFINTGKSIDDTIKVIQNRVSLYMSETWG